MPHAGQTVKPLVKLPRDPSDCWLWLGPMSNSGHGKKTFNGQNVLAHRWMWEILFGPLPKPLVVYTTCETKGCVNPHHLAAGVQAEANRNSVQTKLMSADVAEIKRAKKDAGPNTARVLAEKYGVSPGLVRDIWRGKAWAKTAKLQEAA